MESVAKHPYKTSSTSEPPRQETNRRQSNRAKRRNGRARLSLLLLLFVVILMAVYITRVIIPPSIKASSAILIHAETGRVLYAQHADLPLPPASMSKMMTELLVLDAVRSGQHAWDEEVSISRYAAGVPGSGIGMVEGESYTLTQLFQALIIHSANDAAVAIAEHLKGSETQFVKEMNARAKEIGLSDRTVFANASGLPAADLASFAEAATEGETIMTARDSAMLARWIMNKHPDLLEVTSQRDFPLPQKDLTLHTTNLMLPGEAHGYVGNDGFKTGYTSSAGYCFTGTAARGGNRLISVVMGTESTDQRFTETRKLMNYGFERQGMFSNLLSLLFN
ncbi:D-alanyl-D-alanine carboxypeptidase family protein [Paenibacillus glucanolyticus]|uniref:D-alanyl-D-alanine carboxypeptidase family protein n=1 Tax=Paenibacillus glucanolyticus TaxID=59843 RepID=UPI0036B6E1D6